MNKQEAISKMTEGKKVTHQYFDNDEYVRMRIYGMPERTDTSIYWLSDKHQVSASMFWFDRSGDHWNEGWEIYNK